MAVKIIADRLLQKGIRPWFDEWNLIPGTPWQEVIEDALDSCRTCAVFLGPGGLAPWQNEEMRIAVDRHVNEHSDRFRVIPVLLPGAKRSKNNQLPHFLTRATWVEFGSDINDDDGLHRLVSGIKGVEPGSQAVDVPARWVLVLDGTFEDFDKPRAEALAKHLRDLLGESHLTITKIEPGSIVVHIESSHIGYERLKVLLQKSSLEGLLGWRVLDIYKEDADTLSLASLVAKRNIREIKRVIVVEHDAREASRLRIQGFKVLEADNPLSAQAALEYFEADALVTGFDRHKMAVLELARIAHIKYPNICVIAISNDMRVDNSDEIDLWLPVTPNLSRVLLEINRIASRSVKSAQSGTAG